ncbi:MAG: DEAD/DEAH box helicase [Desulfobacteraceae bacterium]|nr:DEAD/DEAH box helicase [Desulfobacteraceae bacterium]MBC2756925.1 DEAD/DEAH box helicase [Desulfobacteraceae bacterium]
MNCKKDIDEYINSLAASPRLGSQVVFRKEIKSRPQSIRALDNFVSDPVKKILSSSGINNLYSHQYKAIKAIREGNHIVVATPTASGKTIIYNIPFFEKIIKRPDARAIYLFPLKALAQDQLKSFQNMAEHLSSVNATAAVYDGDTTAWHRKKIRETLPNAILTNPEMLHLSFLPYHEKWRNLFENLEMVVVDEVHTYRGVLGSHMAQIFRRFHRICETYGSRPKFVLSSATIANPAQLSEALIGCPVKAETKSGAPSGKRHFVFINSADSPSHTAILLLKAALHRWLRTIVYTQSRKLTELISIWAVSQSGKYAGKISAYRSGFLPAERREIENKLLSGELLAVISTSALELGIDIGDLDLCLLVGYPGTVMSTWQRGGRVGRSGHDSAIILIAGEDALDQYFMRYPEEFFSKGPEAAVINPDNPDILKKHLKCAAAELPLELDESFVEEPSVKDCLKILESSGELLRSGDGSMLYAARKLPHRDIDLRGSGSRFNIINHDTGENMGEVDGFRAFRETHPGAIYLHKGKTFCVEKFDPGAQMVTVKQASPVYYTRVRGDKQTEILDIYDEKRVFSTWIKFGRLKVTDQVTGYEKIHIHGKKRINIIPLDLVPQIFETDGIWIEIPQPIQTSVEKEMLHFMGGIHAIEHAVIGICPLLVLTDRNDFGGIAIPFHPQVQNAVVFVYDAFPGGIGLSREAYVHAEKMLLQTIKVIKSCPCETGCPSCVHSPKCGSGNRPIDKSSALYILEKIIDPNAVVSANKKMLIRKQTIKKEPPARIPKTDNYGVFDIETQKSAQEVGGWHHADQMKISCAVVYDSKEERFFEYFEDDVSQLINHLKKLDLVIGFNIKRFDYHVLSGYSDFNFLSLPTLDLLETIHLHLGYRISLNNLANVNIGTTKSADGLQALRWWKQGRIREIVEYCKKDVEITRDIFLLGRENGYLLFNNKAGQSVRIPVNW